MPKDHDIAWTVVKRMLKEAGASVLRKEAIQYYEEHIADYAKAVAQNAILLMKHADRKTLYKKDVKNAVEMMRNNLTNI